jgi:tellurite resistance protein
MSFSQFVHRVPVSFFGMVLGVFGLGSAWRYAATLGLGPAWLGKMLIFAGSFIWLTLTLIYVGRLPGRTENRARRVSQ